MRPASEDISHRRPVWEVMSDLFLDTELQESDLWRIASTLATSSYSEDELEDIFWGEVYPACICNLRSVAGEWAGINADWIQQRVLANRGKFWLRWSPLQPHRWMVRDDWKRVATLVRDERKQRQ